MATTGDQRADKIKVQAHQQEGISVSNYCWGCLEPISKPRAVSPQRRVVTGQELISAVYLNVVASEFYVLGCTSGDQLPNVNCKVCL